MAFTINRSLIFIDSMHFMNFSLDSLVKNLWDHDFANLSEEFSGKFLKLVKQKSVYLMSIWVVLKSFLKINYLINVNFLVL